MKLFSEKRLEDFNIRWDEVFKDRIEDLEVFLNPKGKEKGKSDTSFNISKLSVKNDNWKNRPKKLTEPSNSSKFTFFSEILFVEKLDDPNVEVDIEKQECVNNKIQGIADELITLYITVTLKDNKFQDFTGDGNFIKKTFVICRTSVESAIYELNKDIIQQMLLKKVKRTLHTEKLQIKSKKSNFPHKKRIPKTDKILPYQSPYYYAENQNMTNDVHSKNESHVVSLIFCFFY